MLIKGISFFGISKWSLLLSALSRPLQSQRSNSEWQPNSVENGGTSSNCNGYYFWTLYLQFFRFFFFFSCNLLLLLACHVLSFNFNYHIGKVLYYALHYNLFKLLHSDKQFVHNDFTFALPNLCSTVSNILVWRLMIIKAESAFWFCLHYIH